MHMKTHAHTHAQTAWAYELWSVSRCPMGVSVPLADHFPSCSSRPSSIMPPLSALPQRISENERKERVSQSKRETQNKLVEKESRVWNWNLHSPYVPSKQWLLPSRHLFSSNSYSPWENNENIMFIVEWVSILYSLLVEKKKLKK